jgi:dephospho-CoA kinase
MHLIGITGGIATGKSTVTNIVRGHGYTVIDGDVIAREVVQPEKPALKEIRDAFGAGVILPDKTLDREALGSLVFSDAEKRKMLNRIVHPAIYREIAFRCLSCFFRRENLVFLDLPLLYESGAMVSFLARVMVVSCDLETQLKRLRQRNPELSEEQAKNRISSQMSLEEKMNRADFVINNSGTVEASTDQVEIVLQTLKKDLTPSWKYRFLDVLLLSLGSLTAYLITSHWI